MKRKDGRWQLVSVFGEVGPRADVKEFGTGANVFDIAAMGLKRAGIVLSRSALRKAFDAAWQRQCPLEQKPSMARRRASLKVFMEMAGQPLPRRW